MFFICHGLPLYWVHYHVHGRSRLSSEPDALSLRDREVGTGEEIIKVDQFQISSADTLWSPSPCHHASQPTGGPATHPQIGMKTETPKIITLPSCYFFQKYLRFTLAEIQFIPARLLENHSIKKGQGITPVKAMGHSMYVSDFMCSPFASISVIGVVHYGYGCVPLFESSGLLF